MNVTLLGRSARDEPSKILYVGIDVHEDPIAVAYAVNDHGAEATFAVGNRDTAGRHGWPIQKLESTLVMPHHWRSVTTRFA